VRRLVPALGQQTWLGGAAATDSTGQFVASIYFERGKKSAQGSPGGLVLFAAERGAPPPASQRAPERARWFAACSVRIRELVGAALTRAEWVQRLT